MQYMIPNSVDAYKTWASANSLPITVETLARYFNHVDRTEKKPIVSCCTFMVRFLLRILEGQAHSKFP